MRSFAWLVLGFFSIYSIQTPQARASAAASSEEQIEAVSGHFQETGSQLLDENGNKISAKDLVNQGSRQFFLVTEEGEGQAIKFKVKWSDGKGGIKYSLTAFNNSSGKVLGRRSFEISPTEGDAVAAKVRVDQTMKSLQDEIESKLGATASLSLKSRIQFALSSLFGIPSVQARGFDPDGVLVLGFFLAVITLMIVAGTINNGRKAILLAVSGLIQEEVNRLLADR